MKNTGFQISIHDADKVTTRLLQQSTNPGSTEGYTLRERIEILVAIADIAGNDTVKLFALNTLEALYGTEARNAVA